MNLGLKWDDEENNETEIEGEKIKTTIFNRVFETVDVCVEWKTVRKAFDKKRA
jgi:hypothetical protein